MNPLQIKWENNQVSTWNLAKTSLVRVVEGTIWLTRTGDPEDSVVEAGQALRLKPGRWVAQSLGKTRYSVEVLTAAKEAHDGQTAVFPVLQRL